jgi:hypothetical protein
MSSGTSASTPDISSILSQVKGLEEEKAKLLQLIEEERKKAKDAVLRAEKMSEGKRLEMEQALNTVIQKWLQDSVQDEKVREEFNKGMKSLVNSAQEDSGVWQVVCNASALHAKHLQDLEAMRTENEQLKTRVFGEFRDDSSRKRPITEVEPDTNIWATFANDIRSNAASYVPDPTAIRVEKLV